jgi:hypothetical protein
MFARKVGESKALFFFGERVKIACGWGERGEHFVVGRGLGGVGHRVGWGYR